MSIKMGLPLQVMRMFCSLCTVTPLQVKMDIMSLSTVLPLLIIECRKSVKVLVFCAVSDIAWNGSFVANFALHTSPLATVTRLIAFHRIGRFTCC